MTKAELTKAISKQTKLDIETTSNIVDNFMEVVKKEISEGGEVTLRGFGTFQNILRSEKNFHYAPGKYRIIPAHYEVKLNYSKEVKNTIK